MPATRQRITRTRKQMIDSEAAEFFTSGVAVSGSDIEWWIWANRTKIFQLWSECREQFKRSVAWKVFESGKPACFPKYIWVTHAAYQQWKAEQL